MASLVLRYLTSGLRSCGLARTVCLNRKVRLHEVKIVQAPNPLSIQQPRVNRMKQTWPLEGLYPRELPRPWFPPLSHKGPIRFPYNLAHSFLKRCFVYWSIPDPRRVPGMQKVLNPCCIKYRYSFIFSVARTFVSVTCNQWGLLAQLVEPQYCLTLQN